MGGLDKFKNKDLPDHYNKEDLVKNLVVGELYSIMCKEGVSKEEVALRLGVSPRTVLGILSGKQNITLKQITQVSSCLGYTPRVVFDKNEESGLWKK